MDDSDGDTYRTYRTMYTIRFADALYVLHAFQKKSAHGAETPQREMETIRRNLARARQIEEEYAGAREDKE